MNSRQLTKSTSNRMITGTIAGICEYFGLSREAVTFARILYVVLAFGSWGGFVLLYFVVSWIIPSGYSNRRNDRSEHYYEKYDKYQERYEDKDDKYQKRWEEKARRYEDKWGSGNKSNGGWSNPWDNPTNSSGRKNKKTEPVEKEDDWSDF